MRRLPMVKQLEGGHLGVWTMTNKAAMGLRSKADAGPTRKPQALPADHPSLLAPFCQEGLFDQPLMRVSPGTWGRSTQQDL